MIDCETGEKKSIQSRLSSLSFFTVLSHFLLSSFFFLSSLMSFLALFEEEFKSLEHPAEYEASVCFNTFVRLFREIVEDLDESEYQATEGAVHTLQRAAEAFLTDVYEYAAVNAKEARPMCGDTVGVKDLHQGVQRLAREIARKQGLCVTCLQPVPSSATES